MGADAAGAGSARGHAGVGSPGAGAADGQSAPRAARAARQSGARAVRNQPIGGPGNALSDRGGVGRAGGGNGQKPGADRAELAAGAPDGGGADPGGAPRSAAARE